MREIKFRGKRLEKPKYQYMSPSGDPVWAVGCLIVDNDGRIYILNDHGGFRMSEEVIPETVGQFTGLKDRNGKEIYEGDILQFDDTGEDGGYEYKEGYAFVNRAVVVFENGRFTLDDFLEVESGVVEELDSHDELCSTMKHSEVIGNIYENPSLLEVPK